LGDVVHDLSGEDGRGPSDEVDDLHERASRQGPLGRADSSDVAQSRAME